MQSFVIIASLVLELVAGQNDPPPLGTNVSENTLGYDNAFNRTWWSVLPIAKLVTWQHLSIERTDGHVVLKALTGTLSTTTPSTGRGRQFFQLISVAK